MKEKNNAIGSTDKYRRGGKYCRVLAPQQRVSMCRPACLHVPTKKMGKTCIYKRFRSAVRTRLRARFFALRRCHQQARERYGWQKVRSNLLVLGTPARVVAAVRRGGGRYANINIRESLLRRGVPVRLHQHQHRTDLRGCQRERYVKDRRLPAGPVSRCTTSRPAFFGGGSVEGDVLASSFSPGASASRPGAHGR